MRKVWTFFAIAQLMCGGAAVVMLATNVARNETLDAVINCCTIAWSVGFGLLFLRWRDQA